MVTEKVSSEVRFDRNTKGTDPEAVRKSSRARWTSAGAPYMVAICQQPPGRPSTWTPPIAGGSWSDQPRPFVLLGRLPELRTQLAPMSLCFE